MTATPRLPKIDEVMTMSGETDRHLVNDALVALAHDVALGKLEAYTSAGSHDARWNVWDNTLNVRITLGSWVRIWCAAERNERVADADWLAGAS